MPDSATDGEGSPLPLKRCKWVHLDPALRSPNSEKNSRYPENPVLKERSFRCRSVRRIRCRPIAKFCKPQTSVLASIDGSDWVSVDSDYDTTNGTTKSFSFDATNWSKPHRIAFFSEIDNSSSDRSGDYVAINLLGSPGETVYNQATQIPSPTIKSNPSYDPDPNHFNIFHDFRNIENGFWTDSQKPYSKQRSTIGFPV